MRDSLVANGLCPGEQFLRFFIKASGFQAFQKWLLVHVFDVLNYCVLKARQGKKISRLICCNPCDGQYRDIIEINDDLSEKDLVRACKQSKRKDQYLLQDENIRVQFDEVRVEKLHPTLVLVNKASF